MISETTNWRIRIPADRLPELKGEEDLRHLVIFGRLMNALRQLQLHFLDAASADGPSGTRQRIGAFLSVASTLHEGLRLLDRIGKTFHVLKAWDEMMVPILRSPRFTVLRESLESVRNQAVFHFDPDCFLEPLAHLDDGQAVLVEGRGRSSGGVYFPLSDLMAIVLFTGHCSSPEEHERRFRELVIETKDLLLAITDAGESVVTEFCQIKGFVREIQVGGEWRAA